jgi:hypothetical protein
MVFDNGNPSISRPDRLTCRQNITARGHPPFGDQARYQEQSVNNPLYAPFAGPLGHLLDICRLLTFRHANPHSYTKYRQIVAASRRTGARTLIETGTYRGVTTRRCIGDFDMVYTIELDPVLAREAQRRLARFSNCKVIEGDAATEVTRLLDAGNIGNNLLIFLDGHFSGGDTAHGDQAEPAIDVLETIARHRDRVAAIVIDDFREFGTQKGWPTKGQLLTALERFFPAEYFDILVHLDQALVLRRRQC